MSNKLRLDAAWLKRELALGFWVFLAPLSGLWWAFGVKYPLFRDDLWDTGHSSDCAVHNAPALPPGPCDCGAAPEGDGYFWGLITGIMLGASAFMLGCIWAGQ